MEQREQPDQSLAKLFHHILATKFVISLLHGLLELEIECKSLTIFPLAIFLATSRFQYAKNVENFV